MTNVVLPLVSGYGEGCVIRWLKAVGGVVRTGEPLVEVEGEKTIYVVDAPRGGVLQAIYAPEGTVLRAGQALGWIGEAGTHSPPMKEEAFSRVAPQVEGDRRELWQAALRRTTAIRMESSWQAPKVDLFAEVDFGAVQAHRRLSKKGAAEAASYNLYIAQAVAQSLGEMPQWNLQHTPQGWQRRADIDIGIAVALGDALTTVSLRALQGVALEEIQQRFRLLLRKALRMELNRAAQFDSSLTITSLGEFEVRSFAALLNPPEPFILAVGQVIPRPVAWQGKPALRPMCTLCLSFDHRVVDGAPASRLLQRIKHHLEHLPLPRRQGLSGRLARLLGRGRSS